MKPIDLQSPISVRVLTGDGWQAAAPSNGAWATADAEITLHQKEAPGAPTQICAITLTAGARELFALCVRWQTEFAPDALFFGDAWERGYGDLAWRSMTPERTMPWYFAADEGGRQSALGVKTGAGALCCWYADPRGVTLIADVSIGPNGVALGGRALPVADVVHDVNIEQDAFAHLCAFARELCPRPRLADHVVYGGNNWYYAYGKSSAADIIADSRYIAELADNRANRPYMVIDDGWQLTSGGGGCNGGPWAPNRLFGDMADLARQMTDVGVRPGVWMRPLLTYEHVPADWVRRTTPQGRALDPTVPGALAYIADAVATVASWGYRLIKHDFTTFDLIGRWGFEIKGYSMNAMTEPFQDHSRTLAEVIRALYRAISDARGSAVLIGCNTVGHLGAGLFELQRTGDDTSGHTWERTRYMGVNTLAMRMPQHKAFFDCDADCVGLTEQVPLRLNLQWLDLLARSGTPLFVSARPGLFGGEVERTLREAFARASVPQPPAVPLDFQYNTAPERWLLGAEEVCYDWHCDPEIYPGDVWWR